MSLSDWFNSYRSERISYKQTLKQYCQRINRDNVLKNKLFI